MRIKSLKLQNIRSYVEETIIFPEGSVLLAGDIGAGKSTVLIAIEYALFGTKRAELEASSLLRNGSHAGRIELTIELENKDLKISRTFKRTATTIRQEAGSLTINNMRLDATPLELRARIMELLGYPKDAHSITKDLIYRYTVFTPQEQMRQILYDDKETRLNTLRKVFGIDKYKKIKENAQFVAKELRTKKRIMEETIITLPKLEEQAMTLSKQKNVKQQQIQDSENCLCIIRKQVFQIRQSLDKVEEQYKQVQAQQQDLALLDAEIKKIIVRKTQLSEKQNALGQIIVELEAKKIQLPEIPTTIFSETIEEEKEALEREIQENVRQLALLSEQEHLLTRQNKELLQQITALTAAVQQKHGYEQQLQELEIVIKEKPKIEEEITSIEVALQQLTKELAAAEIQQASAKDIMRRIQILETCTLCLQHIERNHREQIIAVQQDVFINAKITREKTELLNNEKLQLIGGKKQLLQEIAIAEKKKAVLHSVLETISEKEKELLNKKNKLLRLDAEMSFIEQKRRFVNMTAVEQKQEFVLEKKQLLDKLRQWELTNLEQQKQIILLQEKELQFNAIAAEIKQLEQQKVDAEKKQEFLKKQTEATKYLEELVLKQKHVLEERRQEERQSEIAFITLEKEREFLLQQEKILTAQIEEKQGVKGQMLKVHTYAQWLEEYFVPLVTTMEKQVFLQVHSSFNEYFSHWFTMLLEETGMCTRLDEEFAPIIEQNGYETFFTDLSGGEKTAVALAYRLALNKVINDFMRSINTRDIIILDEPTDGFSAEQLEKVKDVLSELALPQMILVSHETRVESFVDHILRIEKNGHVSMVMK